MDILTSGNSYERSEVIHQQMADGKLDELRQRLEKIHKEELEDGYDTADVAEWYDGRHINEVLFCQQFLDKHPMKCVRGRLFTVDG